MTPPRCTSCPADDPPDAIYEGSSSSTCMYFQPWYDKEGKYHIHDRNRITTVYSCSRGHRWAIERYAPCPTCGDNWEVL